jgi:murein DD-endopeptidase MepM/ murein hydrolase activator NlpD
LTNLLKMGIGLSPRFAGRNRLLTNYYPKRRWSCVNYVVRPGDTLNSIAARFGVSVQDLIRANNLQPPFFIYIGQTLFIPIRESPTPPRDDVDRRLRRLEAQVRELDRRVERLEVRVTRLEGRPRPRS